jgi:hypothetical protein
MAGEQVVVLLEKYQLPAKARYDRYHVFYLLVSQKKLPVAMIQEKAGEHEHKIFQLVNSPVRVELSQQGTPPIAEVYVNGNLGFRFQTGGRNPKPFTVVIKGGESFVRLYISQCNWGSRTPQQIWGNEVKVEEVEGDSSSGEKETQETLQI